MKNHKGNSSGFWFGIALGAGIAVASAYALGTKQGRKKVREIIDASENLPNNLPDIISQLSKFSSHNNKKTIQQLNTPPAIHRLIEKIRTSSNSNSPKRLFTKSP